MGVEPFLIASTVRLVVAQRLVRRLCEHCRREDVADMTVSRLVRSESWKADMATRRLRPVQPDRACRPHRSVRDRPCRRTPASMIAAGAAEDEMAAVAFVDGGRLSDQARAAVTYGLTSVGEAPARSPPGDGSRRGRRLMPVFAYTAVDASTVDGELSAESVRTRSGESWRLAV